ncbi:hypothetical protein BXU09_19165 [Deinococcus sp. LM3]|nr:hypothetical protein BXU09_19165 [Deinococcus sp. LM3]
MHLKWLLVQNQIAEGAPQDPKNLGSSYLCPSTLVGECHQIIERCPHLLLCEIQRRERRF